MYDPLVIYPEGGTTNGTSIIQFKKGAFVSLASIQPKIHKWHSYFQSPCTGVIDGLPQYLIAAASPGCTVKQLELPVFRPNEYFWKHHQKEGEEKWATYMRVIRQIMSDASGLPLSDEKMEEKFDYKKILYPPKVKSE